MKKTTIINKIMNNERFAEVVSVRERLSEKYGQITVTGVYMSLINWKAIR